MNNDSRQIFDFFEPAGTSIKTLTPTAWAGHIPFMFCLINFMKPRTFVELGTHYGTSFFATCQAIENFKIDCFPVAVDLWAGDEHAGYYKEEVYDSFRWIHKNIYGGLGLELRKDFNDAADDFQSKSVDLLHIDGLHTYEAVKNDYETWLPKLSDSGVILLHDTMVRDRGFGVWEFWEEIKNRHTSFNFSHTHGLGIIAFGRKDQNPVVALLEMVNQSEDSKKSFDNFFKLIGERSIGDAQHRIRLEENRNNNGSSMSLPKLIQRIRYFFHG